jgi:hypothetical protein
VHSNHSTSRLWQPVDCAHDSLLSLALLDVTRGVVWCRDGRSIPAIECVLFVYHVATAPPLSNEIHGGGHCRSIYV